MISGRPARRVVCRQLLPLALVALALAIGSGCAARLSSTPLLNSERIAQRFGNFGIEVLVHDEELRISNLYSAESGRRICRTFALVSYPASVPRTLDREHRRIQGGESLGAVFKAHGWRIEKRHRYLGEMAMEPEFARLEQLMGGVTAPSLAVHVYEFSVTRGDTRFDYATIAEIHHPDYLTLADLRAIYAAGNPRRARIDPAVEVILETARRFWSAPAEATPGLSVTSAVRRAALVH